MNYFIYNFFKRFKIISILLISIICMKSALAENSVPTSAIPLSMCDDDKYYCIDISGSVLKHKVSAKFDSGASTFIIPKACLTNYTVIKANTIDEWGDPADIVQGDITLTSSDGKTKYTNSNFQFFATNEATCDENSFINFGTAMDLFFTPDQNYCVNSFFSTYPYPKTETNSAYGFKIFAQNSKTHTPYITIGNITSSEYAPYEITSFNPATPQNCGGKENVKSFVNSQNKGWSHAVIPNISISIGTGDTRINLTNFNAMVDTGGGMAIISDDNLSSLQNMFLQSGLGFPCTQETVWLNNCTCLIPNQTVQFTWNNKGSQSNFSYSYLSTYTGQGQITDLAVCPTWTENSENPYIIPTGINPGFELFNAAKSVMMDFKNGQIAISADKE